MKSDGRRPQRVAEGIRGRLAELIRREAGDPRVAALVITSVEMTDDLGIAKINVRLLAGDDERSRKRVMNSLSRMAGHLRKALGQSLQMKRLPELRFYYDAGVDNERRVEAILDELEAERSDDASETE
ncbi:MAG: 30S ribosome-binding factor RbfA [Polyangiaceae bacterium]